MGVVYIACGWPTLRFGLRLYLYICPQQRPLVGKNVHSDYSVVDGWDCDVFVQYSDTGNDKPWAVVFNNIIFCFILFDRPAGMAGTHEVQIILTSTYIYVRTSYYYLVAKYIYTTSAYSRPGSYIIKQKVA